jgi:hypothetical protein
VLLRARQPFRAIGSDIDGEGFFSVLLPAVCWLGVDAAAPAGDRRLVSTATAVFLGVWALAALALCIAGAFHPGAAKLIPGRSNAAPFLGSAMLIALILFLGVGPFRRTLDAVPHSWLVAAQVGRVMGFLVLSLGLSGILPMAFAGPAGWGDAITGMAAPFVAYALHRRLPGAVLATWLWNAFGLGDLINVALLAAQTTPGTSAYNPTLGDNSNFSLFPTGLLQVMYAPVFILLHVFSIRALVRGLFRRTEAVAA